MLEVQVATERGIDVLQSKACYGPKGLGHSVEGSIGIALAGEKIVK